MNKAMNLNTALALGVIGLSVGTAAETAVETPQIQRQEEGRHFYSTITIPPGQSKGGLLAAAD